MPTIDAVDGIKMNVYSAEHLPPHFHAIHASDEALLVIADSSVYAGFLPAKELRKAREWLTKNKPSVLSVFHQLNPKLKQNERKENKKPSKGTKGK
jgi:hypothetical protein